MQKLKLVEQKVKEYLKDKKTFQANDLITTDDDYINLVLERYKEDEPHKVDEILFKLINDELGTSYYFYQKRHSKGFTNHFHYKDEFCIAFDDISELDMFLTSKAQELIKDKNIQEIKDILNKLLDEDYTSKTLEYSDIEDELKYRYKKDYIELISIDYPKFLIKDEKLALELDAKYTYADFDNADEFLDIAYLDDETKKLLRERADDIYKDEAFNSQVESDIYSDFCYRYDIDREKTSLYDDFLWVKEHNIDDKIIDELLYDLEEKIKNTLENDTLEQIQEAKDFIVLQGGELLYEYLVQEIA